MLYINRVSGWGYRKDDPADICLKADLELHVRGFILAPSCIKDLPSQVYLPVDQDFSPFRENCYSVNVIQMVSHPCSACFLTIQCGVKQWTKQLGTSSFDETSGIATDTSGNVYVTGTTDGGLDGTSAGSYDLFVVKYNFSGTKQ